MNKCRIVAKMSKQMCSKCGGDTANTVHKHRGNYDFTISSRFLGRFISTPCRSFEKLALVHSSRIILEMMVGGSFKQIEPLLREDAGNDRVQGRTLKSGQVSWTWQCDLLP